jgi:hypothetical protein
VRVEAHGRLPAAAYPRRTRSRSSESSSRSRIRTARSRTACSTATTSPGWKSSRVGRPWSFDGDGALFRLVAEANRIRLAHLFDPVLAVHTSLVDPLPHQITAVYEEMLPRQPLRFLLADDPGAGKTIMAGLLIKELIARGDLKRCLIVCPGSLVEQWQDELSRRFHLAVRDPDERQARGGAYGELVPRERSSPSRASTSCPATRTSRRN